MHRVCFSIHRSRHSLMKNSINLHLFIQKENFYYLFYLKTSCFMIVAVACKKMKTECNHFNLDEL